MVALRNSGVVVGQEDSLVDILRRQGIRIPVGRSAPAELMVGIRPTGEVFDPLAKVKTPFCSTHAGRGRGWDYQGARGPEYLDVIWDNPLKI